MLIFIQHFMHIIIYNNFVMPLYTKCLFISKESISNSINHVTQEMQRN